MVLTALHRSTVVEQVDEPAILFAGLDARQRDQQAKPWRDWQAHHATSLGCGDDQPALEVPWRQCFGCLVPKTDVEGTSDNPAQAEIAAAETPTRFVFGRPDRARFRSTDARDELAELRCSNRCKCVEHEPEPRRVVIPRDLLALSPAFDDLGDLLPAEVAERRFSRDATEPVGDWPEFGGSCNLRTVAADRADRGLCDFWIVSYRLAPMAVGRLLRCRTPSRVRQSAKYFPFFSYMVSSGHLRLELPRRCWRFSNPSLSTNLHDCGFAGGDMHSTLRIGVVSSGAVDKVSIGAFWTLFPCPAHR